MLSGNRITQITRLGGKFCKNNSYYLSLDRFFEIVKWTLYIILRPFERQSRSTNKLKSATEKHAKICRPEDNYDNTHKKNCW
jgi:hypothetical protein